MRIFEEQQRFNQWWLYVIIAVTVAGVLLSIYSHLQNAESLAEVVIFTLAGLLLVFVTIGISSLRLETRIDTSGVKARLYPFKFLSRRYQWKEIKKFM